MKKMISTILILSMVLSLVGCSSRGVVADETKEVVQSVAATETDEAKTIGTDPIKIAFCVASMDTNTKRWGEGVESALSVYDNIELKVFDAKGTAETQSQQITEIINQEFDAIIINAVDAAAIATVSTQAEKAGINIVDINFGPQSIHTASVESPSYFTGVLAAEDAMTRIDGGKAVAIVEPVALASMIKGKNGFQDTLEGSGIEFLESQPGDFTTETGNSLARDLLTKYNNDIQVIFCQNDQMAIGAAQAIEAAGMTGEILVYGCDGSPEGIQYINEGKLTGSVVVDPYAIAAHAASIALYSVATGIRGDQQDHTTHIYIPMDFVTAENVDEF